MSTFLSRFYYHYYCLTGDHGARFGPFPEATRVPLRPDTSVFQTVIRVLGKESENRSGLPYENGIGIVIYFYDNRVMI